MFFLIYLWRWSSSVRVSLFANYHHVMLKSCYWILIFLIGGSWRCSYVVLLSSRRVLLLGPCWTHSFISFFLLLFFICRGALVGSKSEIVLVFIVVVVVLFSIVDYLVGGLLTIFLYISLWLYFVFSAFSFCSFGRYGVTNRPYFWGFGSFSSCCDYTLFWRSLV